jgi:hypothetical protein
MYPDAFGGSMNHPTPSSLGQLPKVPFPVFDGDNPKLWQTRCENYFAMYSVDPRVWICVSTMHFTGPAARWLQSVEPQLPNITWPEFGCMIKDRFGRDQHELLIRQLFHIKQTTTVATYVEQFSQLVDQLKAYSTISDPLYYTMRFIDGLRDEIKSVVLVQRPRNLDTAFVLAQLQEEVGTVRKDAKKYDASFTPRAFSRNALPLPPPPRQAGTSKLDSDQSASTAKFQSTDDKLSSLYAYRKAKGLCYKCGLQYTRGHRCADTISLHMVEELWQLLAPPDLEADCQSEPEGEIHSMLLSKAAVQDDSVSRTMKFMGTIQGMELLILLDSGSSHSFLSAQVAQHIQGVSSLPQMMSVQVANGDRIQCMQHIPQAVWSLGACEFQSNLRILPLQTYDLIVGMDWLELYSPMMVHWAEKWLVVPYQGSTVKLFGLQTATDHCSVIEYCQLTDLSEKEQGILSTLPEELQSLLNKFQLVFIVPQGLPPERDHDHQIPLISGGQPFRMRPYRYAPALKSEIERQVRDMLQSGIIQHSRSDFSSSVIESRLEGG